MAELVLLYPLRSRFPILAERLCRFSGSAHPFRVSDHDESAPSRRSH